MANLYLQAAQVLDTLGKGQSSLKATVHATASVQDGARGAGGLVGQERRLLALTVNTLSYRRAIVDGIVEACSLGTDRELQRALVKGGAEDDGGGTGRGGKASCPRRQGEVEDETAETRSRPSQRSLLLVLLHDLLFTPRQSIQAGQSYPPRAYLHASRSRLHSALVRYQLRRGARRIADLAERAGGPTGNHEGGEGTGEGAGAIEVIPRWVRLNPSRCSGGQEAQASMVEQFERLLQERGLSRSDDPSGNIIGS